MDFEYFTSEIQSAPEFQHGDQCQIEQYEGNELPTLDLWPRLHRLPCNTGSCQDPNQVQQLYNKTQEPQLPIEQLVNEDQITPLCQEQRHVTPPRSTEANTNPPQNQPMSAPPQTPHQQDWPNINLPSSPQPEFTSMATDSEIPASATAVETPLRFSVKNSYGKVTISAPRHSEVEFSFL
ncbi:hypothetical protein FALBO_1680 [Fusarium albosuccineum]|uniref:Uncharacterized protein n=1 Tax=Fusarium albosuccineum TaxID=1237068 RepID=A0A8H4LME5_9HYPO|nr:hypothetical protein FALBO_1680 [Fusarium albosuccineum]